MATTQLSFTLRTSPNCKTVHLVGNWDGYQGQLPLSKDASSSRAGAWKGTFRFQRSTLRQGVRYWFYYIIDGYHVSHDPALPYTTEPTTGRQLNILDVPVTSSSHNSTSNGADKLSQRYAYSSTASNSNRSTRRGGSPPPLPKGRPISPSRIVSPLPVHPGLSRITTSEYARHPDLALLSRRFAAQRINSPPSSSSSDFDDSASDKSDSDVPSLRSSNTSSGASSPLTPGCSSPGSGRSSRSTCSCERWGITRKGDRVKLDCGGVKCGYSDDGGSYSCSSSDGESERERHRIKETRRQGLVVRKPPKGTVGRRR